MTMSPGPGKPRVVITEQAETWDRDLDHFTTIGHRFGRVEPRRRIRDYVCALLAPDSPQEQLGAPRGAM
ncbi:hypothetical protein GCM10023329_39750 [Streptomyces sanyensis]|uniref:Transposase n=1 Tax=Streptomyces sanyensis TaxID=568869 RepID=A0ABP9ASU8_9ACTN